MKAVREEDGSIAGPVLADASTSLERYGELYGSSTPMRGLYEQIRRVAPTDATVLILGESGTGKELVARTLHGQSVRRDKAFVAVNCGAIPHHLLEAELFGHEKGSFTGAHQQHAGYFERADGGTLFLDEVTEMPAAMQVKLLRVLETGSFHRVGGSVAIAVELCILAASNKDPRAAVDDGAFREDLLYRLAVFPLRVPPLRERGTDIVALAEHFLAELNRKSRTGKRFSRRGLEVLAAHPWPGNVRELRNAVQRGFILGDDEVDVPEAALRPLPSARLRAGCLDLGVGTPLADAQRQLIMATLAHFGGSKPDAAAALGVSLKTLYNRLQIYLPRSEDSMRDIGDPAT